MTGSVTLRCSATASDERQLRAVRDDQHHGRRTDFRCGRKLKWGTRGKRTLGAAPQCCSECICSEGPDRAQNAKLLASFSGWRDSIYSAAYEAQQIIAAHNDDNYDYSTDNDISGIHFVSDSRSYELPVLRSSKRTPRDMNSAKR